MRTSSLLAWGYADTQTCDLPEADSSRYSVLEKVTPNRMILIQHFDFVYV